MLALSDATWKQMLAMLATSRPGVERVAYLDGVRTGDGTSLCMGVVTTVSVPYAVQRAGHFTVSAEEMSRAGAHLRRHGLVRLAQVHTHPGHDTHHSPTDDESAYSRKAGAVSIVLPWHAVGDPSPTDGAVHVHDGQGWRRLSRADAEAFIRVVPATVDTRPTGVDGPAGQQHRTGCSRGWGRWGPWATIWAHVTRRR
ncbi:MAG TPA: Mov34/MPN/PAD-1 family protein [Nocardioidaceae bacterium]|nr:Mov34/MPN/PAD-1 family protein [Nocardioidaceae bacterium]